MKISQRLQPGRITISCEIFPPKKDGDFEKVRDAAQKIAALRPDFISVTYGAGGGTSKNTAKIASFVQNECGVAALAHLTCVSSTREEIGEVITELKREKIENILALRGDLPADAAFPGKGQFRYAKELIEEIKGQGDFCVGGACYPEGHPECPSRDLDLEHLKQKVESGCEFLTTQMFFDNNVLYSFLYRALLKGIHVPVLAGIMPVVNGGQIKRICSLSGASLPPRFQNIVDKFSKNPAAMKQAGIAYATEQIIDLIANGVRGIHLYTMNNPEVAASILSNLSHVLGREE